MCFGRRGRLLGVKVVSVRIGIEGIWQALVEQRCQTCMERVFLEQLTERDPASGTRSMGERCRSV